MKTKPQKTKAIFIRVGEPEGRKMTEAARSLGLTLASYARMLLMQSIREQK